ncbi:MAG TPA: M56 family metallopeptidase [Vicinamibacterales bacterium]
MITPVIDQASIQALAWALVHFLWQGAVLSLAAFAVFRLPRLRATTKYVAGVATLAAMLASPVATFTYLMRGAGGPDEVRFVEAMPAPKPAPAVTTEPAAPLEVATTVNAVAARVAPEAAPLGPFVILIVWLSGVVLLSLRLFGGWIVARRLITRAVRPVSPEIHSLVRRVAGRMALDRVVRVFESSAVAVPVMVGWIKPVVLLPAAALSGLTPTQVEALIAHELAHVRRHDYIVNLLQSVVETLLFYHPAVWWVSARVRAEREHCCDDLAVGVCDRLVYVTALADLAAMTTTPRVALAATDGSLVNRVRRLLGRSSDGRDAGSSWMPAVVLVLAIGTMVPASYALARGKERAQEPRGVLVRVESIAITSGVQGGVARGVEGGVAGGVSGGVPGGIAGGVQGGVEGGVGGMVAIASGGRAYAIEGQLADLSIEAAVSEPDQWRIERDASNRWHLVRPVTPRRPSALRWRLDRDADGRLTITLDGQRRLERDPELEQAEAALRDRIAKLESELRELRRHYEEMQREYGRLRSMPPLASTMALADLELAQSNLKLFQDRKPFLATTELFKHETDLKAFEKAKTDFLELSKANSLEFEAAREKLFSQNLKLDLDRAKLLDADRKMAEELKQAVEAKSTLQSATTQQGTGNFTWSNDNDRVAVKWTGAFRLSDDDKDIVWVEAGKTVQVSDGGRLFATGVEVKGLADGKVERTYYRNSVARAYEPEGREFLATMLQKVVRVSGFAAETRVERFLKQGGVPAVLAEIELLQGDYARRVYYRELLKQAKVSTPDLLKMMSKASEQIGSDYELASLVIAALGQVPNDDAARAAVLDATKTIGSDYEMRRALTAALTDQTSPKVAASVLSAASSVQSDYERATLLIELARKGGLTPATKAAYFELVKTLRSSYEQGRVLRAVSALPNMSEDVIADAIKSSQTMAGDYERRQFLASSLARQPMTSKSASDVIQAAAGIRSDNEQATLLVDLARRGGVTNETAAAFFPLVGSMTSSYEQRRVLQAVLATGQLTEPVVAGLLKAAASITSDYERAEILVAVVRKQPLSAANRALYLAAGDAIRSEHEQTRVFAELIRSERVIKK